MRYILQFWQSVPEMRSLVTYRAETLPNKGDRVCLSDHEYTVTDSFLLDTFGEIRAYRIWVNPVE